MTRFDYRKLDIRTPQGAWLCPCCGFAGAFSGESFAEDGPLIGTGICPCCMYEPGFDDAPADKPDEPIDLIRTYSAAWFESGMVWRGHHSAIPKGWDRDAQRAVWVKYCRPALK